MFINSNNQSNNHGVKLSLLKMQIKHTYQQFGFIYRKTVGNIGICFTPLKYYNRMRNQTILKQKKIVEYNIARKHLPRE